MIDRYSSYLWILLLSIGYIACKGPGPETVYHRLQGQTMGTYYAITYSGVDPGGQQEVIDSILQDFNNSVSTYIPSSVIRQVNASTRSYDIPPGDPYFLPILDRAMELQDLTAGSLDVSVMPIINYWGFGYEADRRITAKDSSTVDSLLAIVQGSQYTVAERSITKSIPQAQLDFSSLAKGYGIDIIAAYFDQIGVSDYLIDIGGEARASGHNATGQTWTLGINKPQEDAAPNSLELAITLDNKSMATSGNYRIYYEVDGQKYAHIIDPISGYPALSNLLSATIIADDCMTADGLATAMMVKGVEGAKQFLTANPYAACLIYDEDGDEELERYYANGFEKLIMK